MLFPTGQRFSLSNHFTSGYLTSGNVTPGSGDVTSGSGHVTSGHVTAPQSTLARGSHNNLSTNQKPEQGVCMQINVGNFAQ